MDQTKFDDIVSSQFERCVEVLNAKRMEYATGKDRLHNFKQSAALQDISPRKALFGMMSKHLVSIADMCRDDKMYTDEVWDEKITDGINYFLLLKGVLEDEKIDEEHLATLSKCVWGK